MSQPSDPQYPSNECSFWKQAISNGIAAGIGAIICTTALGAFAAVLSFLDGRFLTWLHILSTNWLLTTCVAAILLVAGFIGGVGYAAAAGLFVIEYLWKSMLHQPKPRRGWWLVSVDWLAVAGVWVWLISILIRMNVHEGIDRIRARTHPPTPPTNDEVEQLRAENQRLRAENADLRAQAGQTVEHPPPQ